MSVCCLETFYKCFFAVFSKGDSVALHHDNAPLSSYKRALKQCALPPLGQAAAYGRQPDTGKEQKVFLSFLLKCKILSLI